MEDHLVLVYSPVPHELCHNHAIRIRNRRGMLSHLVRRRDLVEDLVGRAVDDSGIVDTVGQEREVLAQLDVGFVAHLEIGWL